MLSIGSLEVLRKNEKDVSGLVPLTKAEAMELRTGSVVVSLITDREKGLTKGQEYELTSEPFDSFGRFTSAVLEHTTDRVTHTDYFWMGERHCEKMSWDGRRYFGTEPVELTKRDSQAKTWNSKNESFALPLVA